MNCFSNASFKRMDSRFRGNDKTSTAPKKLFNIGDLKKDFFLRCLDIIQANQNLKQNEKELIYREIKTFLIANGLKEDEIQFLFDISEHKSSYFGTFYTQSNQHLLSDLGFQYTGLNSFIKSFSWAFSKNILDFQIKLNGVKFLNVNLSRLILEKTSLICRFKACRHHWFQF